MGLSTVPRLVKNVVRPPHGERDEIHVTLPCGHANALIPERHKWYFNKAGTVISISPSIVCHAGDYHGFYQKGIWS